MSATQDTEIPNLQTENYSPGSWISAIVAGLPHLLIGVLVGWSKLLPISIDPNQNVVIAFGIGFAVLVILLLSFAWRRSWPLWSASWYFYGSWVVFMIIGLTVENLNLEDSWRYSNALFIFWILFCIFGYFILISKSKMHGLLSVAGLFPILSSTMFEFIPNPIEGWFIILVGLSAALISGTIIRIGDFKPTLFLVLGFNLLVGLVWAYISEYKLLDLPTGISPHNPKFSNFLEFFGFYLIFGLGVVALPFILRGMWSFGKRKLAS